MALSIDEANAVSTKYFDQTITSQVYDSNPLIVRLKGKEKVSWDGGTQIQFPIRYRELGLSEAVGPRQQIQYQAKETRTGAVLDWAYYISKAIVNWDERAKNMGKPQIINLLKDKTDEMTSDLEEKLGDDIYATTQGSLNIQSLITIIGTTSSTYAGISQTDASEWYSPAIDTSTTRLTLYGTSGALAVMMNSATFGKDKPDLIITTRNLFSKAESLLEPQKYYDGNSDLAKAGFMTVKFHEADIVADPHTSAGQMFLLCTSQLELRYHPDFNFKVSSWSELDQVGYPNALKKTVSFAGNIVCRERKVQGRYSALDYTL